MRTKTEYRTKNDGYRDFLQYKKKHRFLWFTWYTWSYVADYYEGYGGWKMDCDLLVSSSNWNGWNRGCSLKDFPTKYPNIQDWYDELAEKNKKKLLKEAKRDQEIKDRKNTVKYL